VGGFAGTTWAMVEAGGCPVELDYYLETVARNPFHDTLSNGYTAHPKVDPATGEMHAVVYAWPDLIDKVQYIVVGTDGRVRKTVDIPVPGMVMVHDMSLTQRFAVVYDMPVTVDFDLAFAGRFPFRWNPDYGSRLGFLQREGEAADIVWVDVPVAYSFHPMNAFDTADGRVVIDLCVYDRMFDTDLLGPFGDGWARLERWEIDVVRRTCTTSVIDSGSVEFPRHRGSLTGQPYRFGYATSPNDGAEWQSLKYDLTTGERVALSHGPGRGAGEPVFVSRPDASAEDDGWLLMFVHDQQPGAASPAELVVLDAQEMSRGPVARVLLPQRIPFGFHGNWVSDRSVPDPNS
jgi:carotenoid cleavage dioxygenase